MGAAKLNLRIEQGTTYVGPGNNGDAVYKVGLIPVAVDLTGCTARMQIRPSINSSTVLLELTTVNGRITLGGLTGSIRLNLSAAETAAINWDAAFYDLELVFPNGFVKRLLQGKVTISKEVTRVN